MTAKQQDTAQLIALGRKLHLDMLSVEAVLRDAVYTGTSANGQVTVTMNGNRHLKEGGIVIDEALLKAGAQTVADNVATAFKQALAAIDKAKQEKLAPLTKHIASQAPPQGTDPDNLD